jgi:two-component system LytT family response regulator
MQKYTAIIVDDEKTGMDLLSHFIKKYCPNIEIIATATNIYDAKLSITTQKPQIVFLDIQLNDTTAFELLDEIEFSELEIIFVTAHESYALKAFVYNALDYLLKPILIDDLLRAVNRAVIRIEDKAVFEKQLLQVHKKNNEKEVNFVTINSLDKVDVVKKDDIVFLKSDGRYTTFFLKNKVEIVACRNIGEYEQILDNAVFFRIHHSYIINTSHLTSLSKKNGLYCNMINNIVLPVAKRRQEVLNQFLRSK